jgi:4-carboxymuconolactone decarboxylase
MAMVRSGIPSRHAGAANLVVALAQAFCVAVARAVAVRIMVAAPRLASARRLLRRRLFRVAAMLYRGVANELSWECRTMRTSLVAALFACFLVVPLAAQDRMPPIATDQLTDAQKKAADEFGQGRGYAVRGPFVPLIRSPEVMLRAKAMGDYLRFKSTLGPRLNEMVILITAREWTQQYEWNAHYAIALKEGLRREIADAIADGRRPVGMAEDEDAAYDVATEILRTKRVSDATYRRAVAKFGEQGVIDLLGVVGYYNFLAIVMNATRTALPANVAEPLKRYPE